MKHINHQLKEETRPPMYQIHRYYARKPPNIVATYIEHYSEKGDIILDPFVGSGPVVAESIRLGRKAIGVDLNPLAIFITRTMVSHIDVKEFTSTFETIKANLREKIEDLYGTNCPSCNGNAMITQVIWQTSKDKKNEEPVEIWYECNVCGKGQKKINDKDIKEYEDITKKKIIHWYPKVPLFYENLPYLKGEKIQFIHELFTKRAMLALTNLYREIDILDDGIVKDALKLTFSASLQQVSRNVIVIENRGKMKGEKRKVKDVGSWGRPSYWHPLKHFEINVWNTFENRYKKTLRGKKHSNKVMGNCNEQKTYDELANRSGFLLLNQTSTELYNIPDNTVDYVFTDPPYGGVIQYFELSTIWTSWLGFNPEYENEITINKNQHKDLKKYKEMLKKTFKETYRVLKPNKWLTVTFHSNDKKVWNSIISAILENGFELEKIIYQQPLRASSKALIQPFGSAVGDYYIRFRKSKTLNYRKSSINETKYEKIVVESIKKIIKSHQRPIMYQEILNEIMILLQEKNALLFGKKNIDVILKTHLDKDFILVPEEKNGNIIGYRWWLKVDAGGDNNQ